MTGVKAQWHLADLTPAEADPFGAVVYSAGLKVNLSAPVDELMDVLGNLMHREARLDARGITCHYKDAGQDCLDCPHATLDPENRQSILCRLGKDQQTVAHNVEARLTLSRVMAEETSDMREIGRLDPELADLLTTVGL